MDRRQARAIVLKQGAKVDSFALDGCPSGDSVSVIRTEEGQLMEAEEEEKEGTRKRIYLYVFFLFLFFLCITQNSVYSCISWSFQPHLMAFISRWNTGCCHGNSISMMSQVSSIDTQLKMLRCERKSCLFC